jgi:hypothetical protein
MGANMQEIHCRRPDRGLSMLDNIVTMEETMISYYTPETKRKSKQWFEGKGLKALFA